MKSIIAILLMTYGFGTFGAFSITGEAPYFEKNPILSKRLAIEDALFKASLKSGNSLNSSWRLDQNLKLSGGMNLSSFKRVQNITINKCSKYVDLYRCEIRLSLVNTNSQDFPNPQNVLTGPCSSFKNLDIKKIYICYELINIRKFLSPQIAKIIGLLRIHIKRAGINQNLTRYTFEREVMGLAVHSNASQAHASLIKQGESMFRRWLNSKEKLRLIFEESLLESYVFAIGKCEFECLLEKGIYPVEVYSKGRKVLILGRKMRSR